ncbi:dynamin-like GTPase family protein [Moraxella osloensis]
MFKHQQMLNDNWSELNAVFSTYQSNHQLDKYGQNVKDFIMKMPLVGLFSAGKSSLLNKLLDDKLLSVQITPETAIATELHFSEFENFVGHKPNGDIVKLSREDIVTQNFSQFLTNDENGYGYVAAHINAAVLKNFPHLSLVDLPGLESNLISHSKMIDEYIHQSLAYAIVVSIEDGELRASTQNFLRELKISNTPVILIITKSDLKLDTDIQAISQKIEQSITSLLGRKPIQSVTVSARKGHGIHDVIAAIEQIEAQAETQFDQVVTLPIVNDINFLVQNLDKLLATDNITIEELESEKQVLKEEIKAFNIKITKDTEQFESKAYSIISRIMDDVESKITANLDSLSTKLLNGQEIGGQVESIIRLTVSEGLQAELMPVLQSYVKNIESDMPKSLKIESPTVSANTDTSNGIQFSDVVTVLTPVLALLKFNPIIAVISTIALPVLAKVFDMFRSERKRQAEAEARRESARQAVLGQVIPMVKSNLQPKLNEMIRTNIAQAKNTMQAKIAERSEQVQAQIAQKEKDIQANNAEQELRKQKYATDKAFLTQLSQQLLA